MLWRVFLRWEYSVHLISVWDGMWNLWSHLYTITFIEIHEVVHIFSQSFHIPCLQWTPLAMQFWRLISGPARGTASGVWERKLDPGDKFYNFNIRLDLESIGSSLGIDWELIWSGVEWSGPAIRPGLDNRHLINHKILVCRFHLNKSLDQEEKCHGIDFQDTT